MRELEQDDLILNEEGWLTLVQCCMEILFSRPPLVQL